jgi:hypothetical protein
MPAEQDKDGVVFTPSPMPGWTVPPPKEKLPAVFNPSAQYENRSTHPPSPTPASPSPSDRDCRRPEYIDWDDPADDLRRIFEDLDATVDIKQIAARVASKNPALKRHPRFADLVSRFAQRPVVPGTDTMGEELLGPDYPLAKMFVTWLTHFAGMGIRWKHYSCLHSDPEEMVRARQCTR